MDHDDAKIMTVVEALLKGLPVRIGRYTYQLNDYRELCALGVKYDSGSREFISDILLPVDFSVGDFFNECFAMTEPEFQKVLLDNEPIGRKESS